MDRNKQHAMRVRVDRYTQVCLTVIAVLLTVLIVGLWANAVPGARPAGAAVGAAGGGILRAEIVGAQKETTGKITELIALLKSGEVKVKLVEKKAKGDSGGTNVPGASGK